MRIKYIHVKNFKSFDDEIIELDNLNILLGANAAGKSNTISIFRFINNIVSYGIDDAISLLGGINYAINANIGKNQPLYLKFILDVSNEKWVRYSNRKERMGLYIYEIRCEFEIIPHKRGMGYKIGKDIIEIAYRSCDINDSDSDIEITPKEEIYKIIYKRTGNKIDYKVENGTSYSDESIGYGFEARYLIRYLNHEAKEKKELLLNKIEFIISNILYGNELIKIYDFDPRLMKKSSSITSKRKLEEDGSNIAYVLQTILRNRNEKNRLLDLLNDSLPFVQQIDIQNNVDKSVSYRIRENYNNKAFYSNFLSDGTVNMLALIIALYFEKTPCITIIEEPERNLHPHLMGKIVEMAKDVSAEKQILITTHNPEFVKYAELDSILFAQRTKEGFTHISKPRDNDMVNTFVNTDLGVEELFISDLLGE